MVKGDKSKGAASSHNTPQKDVVNVIQMEDPRFEQQRDQMAAMALNIQELTNLVQSFAVANSRPASQEPESPKSRRGSRSRTPSRKSKDEAEASLPAVTVKVEVPPPHSSTPTFATPTALRLGDLTDPLLASVMAGTPIVPAMVTAVVPTTGMFIDMSSKSKDSDDVANGLGKVALGWGKELKSFSKSFQTANKFKEAASLAEWCRYLMKRTLKLSDPAAIRRYMALMLVVNQINHSRGWPAAKAYAEVWLKKDRAASKGEGPMPGEVFDALISAQAELRAAKAEKSKDSSSAASKKSKGSSGKRSVCYTCGASDHWSNTCPSSSSQPPAQSSSGTTLGGALVVPPPPVVKPPVVVCGKCGRAGHTAAVCRSR